jgi:hypothetical protein
LPETKRLIRVGARALDLFSQRLRENVLIQREVGDEALQPRILVLKRPQLASLADAKERISSSRCSEHIDGREEVAPAMAFESQKD